MRVLKGCVKLQGSYDELAKTNADFVDMINHIQMSTESRKQSENVEKRPDREMFNGRISVVSNVSSVVTIEHVCARTRNERRRMQRTLT